jgi:CHAT domain-containing protein
VLHLATHGFYLTGDALEPMLLSGIALAGANRALADKDDDSILFALEAQGLNLDGSELVVLSACDTARGSLDYSEGVYTAWSARCAPPAPATSWSRSGR